MSPPPTSHIHLTDRTPRTTFPMRFAELWRYREVLKNFIAQDLKVKYRRSALGFFWSLLNPLLQMLVFTIVFSTILRFDLRGYVLFLLAGLLPWQFIAACIDGGCHCILNAEHLIRRQYFPKLVFPLSIVLQNLITLLLSMAVLLTLVGPFAGFNPSTNTLLLPLAILCIAAFAMGLAAFAAVATVHFRDMQHLIGVLVSMWFFLTPVVYPLLLPATETQPEKHVIPAHLQPWFQLNPAYWMVNLFRVCIYNQHPPQLNELLIPIAIAAVALTAGLALFFRAERTLIFRL